MLYKIRKFFESSIIKHIAIFLSALVCFYIASSFTSNKFADKTVDAKAKVEVKEEEKAKAELAYHFSQINDLDEILGGDNGFIRFNNVYCKTESNSSYSIVYLSGSIIIFKPSTDNHCSIETPFSAIIEVKESDCKVVEATVRGKTLNG